MVLKALGLGEVLRSGDNKHLKNYIWGSLTFKNQAEGTDSSGKVLTIQFSGGDTKKRH